MKQCPHCAQEIQDDPKTCPYCHRDVALTQAVAPTAPTTRRRLLGILFWLVASAVYALYKQHNKYTEYDQKVDAYNQKAEAWNQKAALWRAKCHAIVGAWLTKPTAKQCEEERVALEAQAKADGLSDNPKIK